MLIYIPYHDEDNYYQDGILTRESAVLYMLNNMGFSDVISIKKPRTLLDKKRYVINDDYYPAGTVEHTVRDIFRNAHTFQYKPVISLDQVLNRRVWWVNGYKKTESLISKDIPADGDNRCRRLRQACQAAHEGCLQLEVCSR